MQHYPLVFVYILAGKNKVVRIKKKAISLSLPLSLSLSLSLSLTHARTCKNK